MEPTIASLLMPSLSLEALRAELQLFTQISLIVSCEAWPKARFGVFVYLSHPRTPEHP